MSVDVTELLGFYGSPLGDVVRRQIGRVLTETWRDVRGLRVLGLGYATPFLPAIGEGAERVLAFMPARQGVVRWPYDGRSASALIDPLVMPLPDASIDRVLAIHALETAQDPAELLHEIARILTPTGRVLIVFPSRRGLWARMDATPFGHGQPFSRKQMRRLMRDTQLEPETWRETLYMPPFGNALLLRSAAAWEAFGHSLSLPFAGLHVVEASKRLQRPMPIRPRRRKVARQPIFVPVPASQPQS